MPRLFSLDRSSRRSPYPGSCSVYRSIHARSAGAAAAKNGEVANGGMEAVPVAQVLP